MFPSKPSINGLRSIQTFWNPPHVINITAESTNVLWRGELVQPQVEESSVISRYIPLTWRKPTPIYSMVLEYLPTSTPQMTQFCRYIFQHHGACGTWICRSSRRNSRPRYVKVRLVMSTIEEITDQIQCGAPFVDSQVGEHNSVFH